MAQERIEGFRLSPQQRRLWKLQQGDASGPFYTRCVVRIDGELDEERLRAALGRVVARHEVLRTGFDCPPGMKVPLQIIGQGGARLPAAEDLSEQDAAAQSAYIESLWRAPERFEAGPQERESLPAESEPLSARLLKLRPREHVLLLELPSMCGDAATMRILLEEVRRAYSGEPDEGDDPLQYSDLAEWQNELLTAEDTEAGREFWRARAHEARRESRLPFEKRAAPDALYVHARETLHLAPERVRGMERAVEGRSRTNVAALFLLTCWKVLLWRLTGEREVVVGVAYDGRGEEALRDALGPLTKYLPVASRLDERARFFDLLGQVGENFDELLQWHECFNWGCAEDGDGAVGDSALYGFDYEEWPEARRGGAAVFTLVSQYGRCDSHGIRLSCVRRADGLSLEFHYDGRLFSDEDVRRLCAEYDALLRSAASHPEDEIGALDMLGEQERRQVLYDWNATAAEYPRDRLVHELFEAQARRTPDATAVVSEGDQLTYAELDARADTLARHLRRLGVGTESRVGILLERSTELAVALLGVLKAGGAYVPLDPDYPAKRLRFMAEDAGLALLLTGGNRAVLAGALAEGASASVVRLDELGDEAGGDAEEGARCAAISPDNLAYVIYTSGSTGRPKGVMVTHANLLNHMLWMRDCFPLGPDDCVLQKTPFSFDASVWEFYAPLLCGARLAMAPPGAQRDPSQLVGLMRERQVTTLQVVPTLLGALAEAEGLERCLSLRRLFCGGEALGAEVVRRFRARLPGAEVYNLYGPTEATIDATWWACGEGGGAGAVPIGRPVANTQAYVLDGRLRPAPVGTAGELYVGGAQVARGYLNRPRLSAERFVPNPYGGGGGERMYRTGDLARHLPSGEIEFLGRVDHQVKVRGFRIELGEVEAALLSDEGVRECVVVACEGKSGDVRLVAYVVAQGESHAEELRAHLKDRLPEYMTPSAFVMLEALPLLPNGKVDRNALPAPGGVQAEIGADFVAPRDDLERRLAVVWEDVLEVRPLSVTGNFFDLGGHSLTALRLIARVKSLTGKTLSLTTLFEHPTVETLARFLSRSKPADEHSPLVAIQPRGTKRPLFFVHTAGGNVIRYATLARQLGEEQPFYAFQSHEVGDGGGDATVERMAARYVEAMLKMQPDGPYILGGWSMGGIVAFEMARQLHERGRHTALLILLDSKRWRDSDTRPNDAALLWPFALELGLPPRDLEPSKLRGVEFMPYLTARAKEAGLIQSDADVEQLRRFYEIYKNNVLAACDYTPQAVPVRGVLFKTRHRPSDADGEMADEWAGLLAGLSAHEVPGNHYTMMDYPNVVTLATLLSSEVEVAAADEPRDGAVAGAA
jgi:amino acid adenylation domain-containing protein